MPDDTADPFEQFKQEREEQEEKSRSEDDQEQKNEQESEGEQSSSETPNLIDSLKEYTDQEGRPSGFWSHTFDTDEAETNDIQEVSDEKPGGFSSHRLAPEEQEELNEEAKSTSDPPEGFESHRMDQDLSAEDSDPQDDEDPDNEDEQS